MYKKLFPAYFYLTSKATVNDEPPYFQNNTPLQIPAGQFGGTDLAYLNQLNLASFPIVEDFKIKMRQTEAFGMHLDFFSETLGILAEFPWWDNVEVDLAKYFQKDIPVGGISDPYYDLEQSWVLIIFKQDEYVYILEGEEPGGTLFQSWFRVYRESYFNEWRKIIRKFNPSA